MIFNQFDEFGNYLWHYEVTGHAMEEVLKQVMGPNDRYRGMASATGSAGTIASGDYMKELFPDSKIVASEALQCPTLLENGFGAHRIEGIGDKHVPWIHNTKNTDVVVAIDDNAVVNISRLFNEETGRAILWSKKVFPKRLSVNSTCLVSQASRTSCPPSKPPSTTRWARTTSCSPS
jgi:cysteine synthase